MTERTGRDSGLDDAVRKDLERLRDHLIEFLEAERRQPPEAGATSPAVAAKQVGEVIRLRALRSTFFGDDLFADPAWDILLDLYHSHLTEQRVSITTACMAANIPVTTGLRWLGALEERKLVEKQDDPRDGRRTFVSPSPKALAAMNDYFNLYRLSRRV